MSVRSTNFVSYKFIDSQGNLRDKIVRTGKRVKPTFFDGSSFGFRPTNDSDLLLVPDTESEHFDPIRNMSGIFCFIRDVNNKPIEGTFRNPVQQMMCKTEFKGALFGVEPEFFVCKRDAGNRYIPVDIESAAELDKEEQYKWYGCLPPLDTFQNVRDEIATKAEKAGIRIEAIHHEVAPGQCEFSWECSGMLKTCDRMMLFKYITDYVCRTFGFEADFRAKPFDNLNGNGCHVHQSIPSMKQLTSGNNVVINKKVVEAYAQGLVDHYDELFEVCCVGETSSKRLVPGFEAPTKDNNGWGYHDRTKTVRIPGTGDRVELRLPDPEMNPYVTLPIMLKCGLKGVSNEEKRA